MGTLGSVGAFAASKFQFWAWLAMAFLFSWVVALFWTAHDEHRARIRAENSSLTGVAAAREELRIKLIAALREGDSLRSISPNADDPRWRRRMDWMAETHLLFEEYLGPIYAERFSLGEDDDPPGENVFIRRLKAIQAHLDNIGMLTIMKD